MNGKKAKRLRAKAKTLASSLVDQDLIFSEPKTKTTFGYQRLIIGEDLDEDGNPVYTKIPPYKGNPFATTNNEQGGISIMLPKLYRYETSTGKYHEETERAVYKKLKRGEQCKSLQQ